MKNRLETLYRMQLIDDQLDELEELRGDLPLAVNDLNARIQEIKDAIAEKESLKEDSLERRNENDSEIDRLGKNLKKFKSQLYQVRNNKEYDALTKEIDNTEENINNLENENIAIETLVEEIKVQLEELKPGLDTLNDEIKLKKTELKKIIKTNEKEEVKLQEQHELIASEVKKNDLNTYNRVRKACRGKAIVTINRSACTGCHNVVPPQRQLEIKQTKRVFTCENCGRILISPEISEKVKAEL